MHILIFGASGATGQELVKLALTQGYFVTAFVRTPSKLTIKHNNLRIFQGDVTDAVAVDKAVKGQVAVLCALGASSPFKRDFALTDGVRNIARAMEKNNVQRLIYLSVRGVRENQKDLGFFTNFIIAPLLQNVIKDHEDKEHIIKQSQLDWTIVRPPMLTNGKYTGKYRTGEHLKLRPFLFGISRADLADFMLQQLKEDTFSKKAPLILH